MADQRFPHSLVLPDPKTTALPALRAACIEIRNRRDELVGHLAVDQAMEWQARALAIERYLRGKEGGIEATHAARVLDLAVGAALGEAEPPTRQPDGTLTGSLSSDSVAVPRMDRHRFRLMAGWRKAWEPALEQNKPLSRNKVLQMIEAARRPDGVGGEGRAEIRRMDAVDFLHSMAEGSADLLLTDPPYSTDLEDVRAFVASWISLAIRRLASTGRAFVFIGAYGEELGTYFSTSLPEGWRWGVPHAWVYKNTIGPTPKRDFIRNWQCVLSAIGPDAADLESNRITDLLAGFVDSAPDGRRELKYHKWQKPLACLRRFIRLASPPDGIVLDPFAGSGSTLIAAQLEGRIALGCDNDPEVIKMAVSRGCIEAGMGNDVG